MALQPIVLQCSCTTKYVSLKKIHALGHHYFSAINTTQVKKKEGLTIYEDASTHALVMKGKSVAIYFPYCIKTGTRDS